MTKRPKIFDAIVRHNPVDFEACLKTKRTQINKTYLGNTPIRYALNHERPEFARMIIEQRHKDLDPLNRSDTFGVIHCYRNQHEVLDKLTSLIKPDPDIFDDRVVKKWFTHETDVLPYPTAQLLYDRGWIAVGALIAAAVTHISDDDDALKTFIQNIGPVHVYRMSSQFSVALIDRLDRLQVFQPEEYRKQADWSMDDEPWYAYMGWFLTQKPKQNALCQMTHGLSGMTSDNRVHVIRRLHHNDRLDGLDHEWCFPYLEDIPTCIIMDIITGYNTPIQPRLMERLLDGCPNIHELTEYHKEGETFLHRLARTTNNKVQLNILMKRYHHLFDVNATDWSVLTPLHHSLRVKEQHPPTNYIARLLIMFGADVKGFPPSYVEFYNQYKQHLYCYWWSCYRSMPKEVCRLIESYL